MSLSLTNNPSIIKLTFYGDAPSYFFNDIPNLIKNITINGLT